MSNILVIKQKLHAPHQNVSFPMKFSRWIHNVIKKKLLPERNHHRQNILGNMYYVHCFVCAVLRQQTISNKNEKSAIIWETMAPREIKKQFHPQMKHNKK